MSAEPRVPLFLRLAGELVIIVVGVLIALWVDNLNQDRRDAAREGSYLRGILVDLRSDSADLTDRRDTAIRGLHVADRLLDLRDDPGADAEPDSLATWMFQAAFIDNFQVLDHTYREVLGAGGLGLIRNETIRRSISSYYRSIESADFFTDFYKKEETDYWDLLAERMAPDDFIAVSRRGEQRLDATRVLEQLRSDPEIPNAIEMNRHWTELRLGITERRLAANRRLAETLTEHLGDR